MSKYTIAIIDKILAKIIQKNTKNHTHSTVQPHSIS